MENVNVVSIMNLNPVMAKRIIADILKDSGRVFFSKHAEQRMKSRKITRTQVVNCIKNGVFTEDPAKDIKGGWKMTLESLAAGDPIGVSLLLDKDDRGNYILIITTYIL